VSDHVLELEVQYGEASHFASKEQVLAVASRTLEKD